MGNILTKDQYGVTKGFYVDKMGLAAYYNGWRFQTRLQLDYYELNKSITFGFDATFFEGGTYFDSNIAFNIFGLDFEFDFGINRRDYERRLKNN